MKNILPLAFFLLGINVFGQAPQKLNYQGALRDVSGNIISNQLVGIRLSVLQGSPNGGITYRETHSVTTNTQGLYAIKIGEGVPVNGIFSTINWASGPFYLQTEVDPAGGTNYSISGSTELVSVPYALYAEKSGTSATVTELPAAQNGGLVGCKNCPTQWSSSTLSTNNFANCSRYCGSLTEGGLTDWRVPTLLESVELTESSQANWNMIWTSTIPGLDGVSQAGFVGVGSYYSWDFQYGQWNISTTTSSSLECRCIR